MQELNDVIDVNILNSIAKQPQVQCSTKDQFIALHALAVKFGLYDAADVVRRVYIERD